MTEDEFQFWQACYVMSLSGVASDNLDPRIANGAADKIAYEALGNYRQANSVVFDTDPQDEEIA